jgi:hypothetical protein
MPRDISYEEIVTQVDAVGRLGYFPLVDLVVSQQGVMMSVQIVRESPDLTIATLIASSGFVQPISPELQGDVDVHLREGQIVYSIMSHNEVAGFAIFKTFGDILYLGGIILRDDHQGTAIAPRVIQLARETTQTQWLGLRTQSPIMWASAKNMVRSIFPHPSEKDVQTYLRAQRLARELGMGSPFRTGFYGGPLYGKKPIHRDAKIQDWWDSFCQFERGDAVVVVGRF